MKQPSILPLSRLRRAAAPSLRRSLLLGLAFLVLASPKPALQAQSCFPVQFEVKAASASRSKIGYPQCTTTNAGTNVNPYKVEVFLQRETDFSEEISVTRNTIEEHDWDVEDSSTLGCWHGRTSVSNTVAVGYLGVWHRSETVQGIETSTNQGCAVVPPWSVLRTFTGNWHGSVTERQHHDEKQWDCHGGPEYGSPYTNVGGLEITGSRTEVADSNEVYQVTESSGFNPTLGFHDAAADEFNGWWFYDFVPNQNPGYPPRAIITLANLCVNNGSVNIVASNYWSTNETSARAWDAGRPMGAGNQCQTSNTYFYQKWETVILGSPYTTETLLENFRRQDLDTNRVAGLPWTPSAAPSASMDLCENEQGVSGSLCYVRLGVPGRYPTNLQFKVSWDEVWNCRGVAGDAARTAEEQHGRHSVVFDSTNLVADGTNYAAEFFIDMPSAMAPWFHIAISLRNVTGEFLDPSAASEEEEETPGARRASGAGGCASCGGGEGGSAEAAEPDLALSLGRRSRGGTAGIMRFLAPLPGVTFYRPVHWRMESPSAEVQTFWTNAALRQVVAPQTVVDLVTISSNRHEVRFYLPAQASTPDTNGLRSFTGNAFRVWVIENPYPEQPIYDPNNPTGPTSAHLAITEVVGGSTLRQFTYHYTPAQRQWSRTGPLGETVFLTHTNWGDFRRDIREVWDADDQLISFSSDTYQQFSWGEARVEHQEGFGPDAQVTTYTYMGQGEFASEVWTATNQASTLPLRQVVRPDGSWDRYGYDSQGRITGHYSAFGDQAPTSDARLCRLTTYDYTPLAGTEDVGTNVAHTARTVVEYQPYNNTSNEVSRTYTIVAPTYQRTIRCATAGAAPGAADNLVTTTYYDNDAASGRTQRTLHPDGTLSVQYERVDGPTQHALSITETGQPNGDLTAVTNGTRTRLERGPANVLLSRTNQDIASGIVLSSETCGNFDAFGRPQAVTNLNNRIETIQYGCCGLESRTDADGVATTYLYDAARRQTGQQRLGVTHDSQLDPAGRLLSAQRSVTLQGNPWVIVTARRAYDTAGRLLAETNAANAHTLYGYDLTAEGGLLQTTTFADGGQQVEAYYRDGRLREITGSAVHGTRYAYAMEGGLACTLETKLDAAGQPTSEWTKTYSDLLGRTVKTVQASGGTNLSFYNLKGQLTNQVDPDGLSTLLLYNALGEQEYTVLDTDHNGVTWGGSDRVTRTVREVVLNAANVPVRRTISSVWLDGASTGTALTTNEVSTDGLQSWSRSAAGASHSVTAYGANGLRTVAITEPDGTSTLSVYQSGLLQSVSRLDTASQPLGQTSYGYDAFNRPVSTTDARTGLSRVVLDSLDRAVTNVTTTPGTGGPAQTTVQFYDSRGRVCRTLLPDGTSVTNEFYLTGELYRTSGSRTYPVQYTYDDAGRMKTMTTWQTYPSAGDATTTWSYDSRGLLTNKVYQYSSNWTAYAHSAGGRLTNRAWARGLTTGYTYNNAGDLSLISYSDGTAVTNTYDRLGRLTAAANSTGLVQRAYDLPGNLLTETQNGIVVSNTFDSLNRRRNVTVHSPAGALASASYDFDSSTRRLGSVSDGTNTAAYSYLANSPLVGQIAFSHNGTNVMTTTKQYDRLNRLTRVQTLGASPVPLASFDSAYNDANQRVRVAQADGSYWLYRYDRLGQVVSGKKYWRDGTPVTGQQYEYTFDAIGNRTETKTGGDARGTGLRPAAYTNNLLNQITGRDVPGTVDLLGIARANASVTVNSQPPYRKDEYFAQSLSWNNATGAVSKLVTNWAYTASDQASMSNVGRVLLPKTPETFTYDLDGNLTRDGLWNYVWDAENRLIRMTSRASIPTNEWQSLGFRYDSQSRRISKTVSNWTGATWALATEQRFVYDGWNLLAVLNPDLSPQTTFTWGSDASGTPQGAAGVGGLLSMTIHCGTNAGTYFYCYDGNWNVAALMNAATAEVAAQYEHGPFHELIRATGPLGSENPFLAATECYDWKTGLYYYGYRYYSPATGRWLCRDPLEEGGGPNLFAFNLNEAISLIDPLGLVTINGTNRIVALQKPVAQRRHRATYTADADGCYSWRVTGPARIIRSGPHYTVKSVELEPTAESTEDDDVVLTLHLGLVQVARKTVTVIRPKKVVRSFVSGVGLVAWVGVNITNRVTVYDQLNHPLPKGIWVAEDVTDRVSAGIGGAASSGGWFTSSRGTVLDYHTGVITDFGFPGGPRHMFNQSFTIGDWRTGRMATRVAVDLTASPPAAGIGGTASAEFR